jgi:predicted RNase H-like nuclease
MAILLVGFDAAWTLSNSGALVGVVRLDDGTFCDLGPPEPADYSQAEHQISSWQCNRSVTTTVVLLDQPTIVRNSEGQRPVENIVSSPVGRRRGGVQPANTGRKNMFGEQAPVWPFLMRFGGAADPLRPLPYSCVFETYPVLALIALGWILEDSRPGGRLPKYNPERRGTFLIWDWQFVCNQVRNAFSKRGLTQVAQWISSVAQNTSPRKSDQDCLDACICLLVALYLIERKVCLMVGDLTTGYIVVPHSAALQKELEARCRQVGRVSSDWVRAFTLILPESKNCAAFFGDVSPPSV